MEDKGGMIEEEKMGRGGWNRIRVAGEQRKWFMEKDG